MCPQSPPPPKKKTQQTNQNTKQQTHRLERLELLGKARSVITKGKHIYALVMDRKMYNLQFVLYGYFLQVFLNNGKRELSEV